MPIECKVTTISTWLAPITVVETARGVRFVDLDDGARQFRREAAGEYIRVPGETEAADELRRYFAGELHVFSVPLDLCGTPFQLRCWEAMRGIPYGQTITYAQEGLMAGQPQKPRAHPGAVPPGGVVKRPRRVLRRPAGPEKTAARI